MPWTTKRMRRLVKEEWFLRKAASWRQMLWSLLMAWVRIPYVDFGEKVEAKSNWYAIYRTAYPVGFSLVDPLVAERFKILENGKTVNEIWVGYEESPTLRDPILTLNRPDMHLFGWRSEDMMSWLITHKVIFRGFQRMKNTKCAQGQRDSRRIMARSKFYRRCFSLYSYYFRLARGYGPSH